MPTRRIPLPVQQWQSDASAHTDAEPETAADDESVNDDASEGKAVELTQAKIDQIRNNAASMAARKARKALAEELGLSIDEAKALIERTRQADEEAKTEAQRATEAADKARAEAEAALADARRETLKAHVMQLLNQATDETPPVLPGRVNAASIIAMAAIDNAGDDVDHDDPLALAAYGVEHARAEASELFGTQGDDQGNPRTPQASTRLHGQNSRKVNSGSLSGAEAMAAYRERAKRKDLGRIRFAGIDED